MKWRFAVIDRIEKNNDGNLYDRMVVVLEEKDDSGVVVGSNIYDILTFAGEMSQDRIPSPSVMLSVKTPNFKLAEIIILDNEYGRDYLGDRKPSKWNVGYTCFDTIEEAIKYSQEVYKNKK